MLNAGVLLQRLAACWVLGALQIGLSVRNTDRFQLLSIDRTNAFDFAIGYDDIVSSTNRACPLQAIQQDTTSPYDPAAEADAIRRPFAVWYNSE